jgi:nucleotide-binding universal stress UspA family protein
MDIRVVLCPIDFSKLAERELDLAIEVCQAFGARLVLHHNVSAISLGFSKAWEWEQAHRRDGPSTDEAERRVQGLRAQLPVDLRTRSEAVITHGPLATVLLALAEKLPADVLVLGTHGWSTEDHASVTERVIERAPCPVLTVGDTSGLERFRLRAEPGGEMPRLVVPTDFSPSADKAVAWAIELARARPLRLDLLHVTQGPGGKETMDALDRLVPADLRARVECHLRVGRTEEEIEGFVRRTKPQLVVVGTHARSFWRRLFTRDVARQLLHGTTCPVCFVPPTTA